MYLGICPYETKNLCFTVEISFLSLIKNFDINSYIPESSFPFWLSCWHSGYLCFVRGEEARWVLGGGGRFWKSYPFLMWVQKLNSAFN